MRRVVVACVAAAALVVSPLAARAADANPAKPPDAKAAEGPPLPPAPPPEPPPPYEPQLERLSELLGALAFLRDLCGEGDGAKFRARMATLLEDEGATPARRESLAGAYNKGYRDYAMSYRVCTPAATTVIARYLDETARLASDLANRYGG